MSAVKFPTANMFPSWLLPGPLIQYLPKWDSSAETHSRVSYVNFDIG